jgi:hypothetical protein
LANRDVVQTLGLAAHQTNDLCRFAHPIAEVGLDTTGATLFDTGLR